MPSLRLIVAILLLTIGAACSQEAKKTRLAERAERYFKAGEYEKAKIECLNLLRADPVNPGAIRRLGFIWFEQGAPLQAVRFLHKAREQTPDNLVVRTKLASAFAGLGLIPDARKEAVAILEMSPTNGDAIMLLADTARTKEEIEQTSQQLKKFPQRDSASFLVASARGALRNGDAGAAETLLQRAIASEPKSPVAHRAMGNFYVAQKNLTKAGEEYKTAAELSPPRSIARLQDAEFKMQTGAAEEAKRLLKEITRQAPDYVPAWRLLGQIALAEKKYDDALLAIERALSVDRENPDVHMLQAQVWLTKGEIKKAIEGFEQLDQTYRNVPGIKLQLARALVQDGNLVKAMTALKEAVQLDPGQIDAIMLLAELDLRSGQPQPVITAMRSVLEKRPNFVPAQKLLAEAYRSVGRLDEAAAVIQEQIAASPKRPESYFALGVVLRQQGKMAEARQAFEQAAQAVPGSFAPVYQLVEMDIDAKDFEAAAKKVREQLGKDPKLAGAHFLDGKIHAAQRQWNEAEAALQKTLDLDPNFSGAYDLLISIYIITDRLPQALERLTAISAKEPHNTAALMLSASIHQRRGDFAKARDAYEAILAAQPESPAAQNNLAYLYAERLNQPDKAYEFARKARVSQPENAPIADTLGWILYKRGEYQQATALLRESAAGLPDNSEAQFHFGMASYMMGDVRSARSAFEQALRAPADFPGKEEAKRRLDLLTDAEGGAEKLSVEELEALLQREPNGTLVRMRLAAAYEKQQAFAKAVTAYEEAIKLNPNLIKANAGLARLFSGPLKNDAKAFEYAKTARELAPNDPQVAAVFGEIAYRSGQFTSAYNVLQDAARELPNDPAILHNFAWAAYSLGKVAEARENMERLASAAPNSAQAADAKSFLAMTGVGSKDLATAEPEAEKLLKADPNYVPALMVRAAMQAQRNESKAAAGTYNEVLRRFPNFVPAQKSLAAVYAEDPQETKKAYDFAVKAREALPDDPEVARTLAAISYKKKEFDYAVQLFEESAKASPLDARSLFYLGMSHLGLKHKPESRKALDQALAAGLQEPFATEAKRAIAEQAK